MKIKLILFMLFIVVLSSCSSVTIGSRQSNQYSKKFNKVNSQKTLGCVFKKQLLTIAKGGKILLPLVHQKQIIMLEKRKFIQLMLHSTLQKHVESFNLYQKSKTVKDKEFWRGQMMAFNEQYSLFQNELNLIS